jgi:hypothetical protein
MKLSEKYHLLDFEIDGVEIKAAIQSLEKDSELLNKLITCMEFMPTSAWFQWTNAIEKQEFNPSFKNAGIEGLKTVIHSLGK